MEMTFQNSHNPLLLPQFHVPDGEAHVMPDGKLYIYGSYDDCELAYCSDFYRVISTPDMKTWTVHQKAMEGAAVPWFREDMAGQVYGTDEAPDTPFIRMMNAAIADDPDKDYFGNLVERERTALLYAPDGAHKDGKYYLYFCMEDGSEGVGISDRPEGPFGDFRQLPAQGIDPAILVDDDGNAYYFWGQFSARGVKLNPDMVSYDPAQVKKDIVTEEEHFFHEGFSIRRIGDTYYAVFSEISRGKPTALGYATAKHPLGPYTYADDISQLVSALATFYKISISKGREFITLKEELLHSKMYLRIFDYRFEGQVITHWNIDPKIEEISIPKITLQPIIENAVIHGIFEREGSTGTLHIKAWREADDVYISIADNGVGMTPEVIAANFAAEHAEPVSATKGYGVSNVNERLRIAYGPGYGLSCTSVLHEGTTVLVHIPAKQ